MECGTKKKKSRHKYKTTDSTAVALYKAKERSNLQLYTLLKRSSYLEARFSAANPYSTWVGPVTTNAWIAVLKALPSDVWRRSQFELLLAAASIWVPLLLAFLGLRGKRDKSLKIPLQLMSSIFSFASGCCDEEYDWHKLTEDVRGPLFFFSAFSRSSSSMFSRSMSVISVLHLLWSSCGYITVLGHFEWMNIIWFLVIWHINLTMAVRDLRNQSKRNWGELRMHWRSSS